LTLSIASGIVNLAMNVRGCRLAFRRLLHTYMQVRLAPDHYLTGTAVDAGSAQSKSAPELYLNTESRVSVASIKASMQLARLPLRSLSHLKRVTGRLRVYVRHLMQKGGAICARTAACGR
jgi:hypothetical protein